MAKKNNQTLNIGEIGTIRDILMGQQMAEYEDKFELLLERLAVVEAQLEEKLNSSEEKTTNRIEELNTKVSTKFDSIEKVIEQKVTHIQTTLVEGRKSDNSKLGEMLKILGQKLIEGEL